MKGKFSQKICETRIADNRWAKEHWLSIKHAYAKCEFFDKYCSTIEQLYEKAGELELLSEVNFLFIEGVCDLLGIETKFKWSSEFELKEEKTERLLGICLQTGATSYTSGAAAQDYLDVAAFQSQGVGVVWYDYSGYPEYKQPHGDFDPYVTILDLIFNAGENATQYMLSFGNRVKTAT